MSDAPIEEKAPSKVIEVFLWVVFIVPMIFVWVTVQSIPLIVILLVVRLGIMAYPRLKGQKQPVVVVEQKKEEVVAPLPQKRSRTIITLAIEEAVAEWKGLLKFLRIYDYDVDNKYLETYRKLKEFR
jgi:ABC-type bacteriocin/lantibiotic exporter with double-glycine peptidase domain